MTPSLTAWSSRLLLLFLFIGLASGAWAQSAMPTWEAQLTSGTYRVTCWRMVSVSTHTYVVDGVMQVYELTVDTDGQALARFYCIEPVTAAATGAAAGTVQAVQQQATTALKSLSNNPLTAGASTTATQGVAKHYPTTTHARSIEYRVPNRDAVDKLYKSAETAMRTGRDVTIKIEG